MKNLLSLIATISTILFLTFLSVFYSEGWRINPSILLKKISKTESGASSSNPQNIIVKTGMLAVRSIPDGAKVYLDDKLITATDDTISSLDPKKYTLRVEKEGFETWKKDITIYPELVTDITAVLISQTPRLEPLTNTDVTSFAISSSYNEIAFTTSTEKNPGVWILPLSNSPINILRNSAQPLIVDTADYSPSKGQVISWSPDDKELTVQMNPKGYFLYKVDKGIGLNPQNEKPTQYENFEKIIELWNERTATIFSSRLNEFAKKQQMPADVLSLASKNDILWSPDERKFAIETINETDNKLTNITIYNGDVTLPVGEERVNRTLIGIDKSRLFYTWYTDSYHLILVEQQADKTDSYTVSIIRIDGSNLTKIYTGYLTTRQAYSTPNGDKIVVLTSLKEGSKPNLYGIAIR